MITLVNFHLNYLAVNLRKWWLSCAKAVSVNGSVNMLEIYTVSTKSATLLLHLTLTNAYILKFCHLRT